ncbi:hypothetical protein SUGI_1067500 [Cryptomeria japonica]|nr:hypothetical protein SUGI_1067500 [Cryptomeria japonica]
MESYIVLSPKEECRMMAFRGKVKKDRWHKVLLDLDDLSVRAIQEIMGEDVINYDYRFRVNLDILATFMAILLVIKVSKADAIFLCKAIFRKELLWGMEIAVNNVDEHLRIPFPKNL